MSTASNAKLGNPADDMIFCCLEPNCGGSWCVPHSRTCKVGKAEHELSEKENLVTKDAVDRTCQFCDFVAMNKKALKKHKCDH